MKRTLLGIVIVLFASSIADADPADDQMRKKLRAYRAYTLTEELALDEATAGRLFPMLARFDAESDKIAARRGDIQKRIATTTDKSDARVTQAVVDEAVANQRWQRDFEDRRLADLRKVLSNAQIARVVLLLPELDTQMYPTTIRSPIHARPSAITDDDDAPMPSTPVRAPAVSKKKACDPFNTPHGCKV